MFMLETKYETKIGEMVELIGEPKKLVAQLSASAINSAMSKYQIRESKLATLRDPHITDWQYADMIKRTFVHRRFSRYGGRNQSVSIGAIKAEIERKSSVYNIILTGPAGSGKTTALKWLYLSCEIKGYSCLYLCAQMFSNCRSLQELFLAIEGIICKESKCLVFFDGLDELKCFEGTSAEFESFVQFLNRQNKPANKSTYKFIMATRSEYFSFQRTIQNHELLTNIDNYAVFEIQSLTPRESFLICKSIRKIRHYETKKICSSNQFADMWPSGRSKNELSEARYLHMLKQYIKTVNLNQSLFVSPLLCRYAYPIIREWGGQEKALVESYQSGANAAIGIAIRTYITCRFCNTHPGIETRGGSGAELLQHYRKGVFDFYSEIAGRMGTENVIRKQDWEGIKTKQRISGDISFCMLQEYGEEYLTFIHELFRDYFLASYCVKMVERNLKSRRKLTEKDFELLNQLLKAHPLALSMYVDQLVENETTCINHMLHYLLQYTVKNDINKLVDLAKGRNVLIYTESMPFSIKEYLIVFPLGKVEYGGIYFDCLSFCKLQTTGILQVRDIADFHQCKRSCIAANAKIRGVECQIDDDKIFRHLTCQFYILHNGILSHVGGYWKAVAFEGGLWDIFLDAIKELSHDEPFLAELESKPLAAQSEAIGLNPELERKVIAFMLELKREKDEQHLQCEKERLKEWIMQFTTFIDRKQSFWCLLNNNTLSVFQTISQNRHWIVDQFVAGMVHDSADFVALYGNYKALTEDLDTWRQNMKLQKVSDISFTFDAMPATSLHTDCPLAPYYDIHWKNLQLLKAAYERNYILDTANLEVAVKLQELCELYLVTDLYLAETPDNELRLHISDEELLTLYVAGRGDEMVELAEKTLPLCKIYHHVAGEALRERLLSDNCRFNGEDLKMVYTFAREYIWL